MPQLWPLGLASGFCLWKRKVLAAPAFIAAVTPFVRFGHAPYIMAKPLGVPGLNPRSIFLKRAGWTGLARKGEEAPGSRNVFVKRSNHGAFRFVSRVLNS